MMKFSDALSEEVLQRVARNTIARGNVYRITMTQENGIVPKRGDKSRDKFFVVLGSDKDKVIYGGVIINSRINPNLPKALTDYHMPIKQSKYPFLQYDSFVDCLELKRTDIKKFDQWEFLGKIDEYDTELIMGTIKESPRASREMLNQFGL